MIGLDSRALRNVAAILHDHADGGAVLGDCRNVIPNLVAERLAESVEDRMRRNLTLGYQVARSELTCVRGRIDWLTTERPTFSPGERWRADMMNSLWIRLATALCVQR